MAAPGDMTYFHNIGRKSLDPKSRKAIYLDRPDFSPKCQIGWLYNCGQPQQNAMERHEGDRMPLKCPSCDIALTEFGSVIDIFKCSKENILWKLLEKEDGSYLKKLHAPRNYKGQTLVKIIKT